MNKYFLKIIILKTRLIGDIICQFSGIMCPQTPLLIALYKLGCLFSSQNSKSSFIKYGSVILINAAPRIILAPSVFAISMSVFWSVIFSTAILRTLLTSSVFAISMKAFWFWSVILSTLSTAALRFE